MLLFPVVPNTYQNVTAKPMYVSYVTPLHRKLTTNSPNHKIVLKCHESELEISKSSAHHWILLFCVKTFKAWYLLKSFRATFSQNSLILDQTSKRFPNPTLPQNSGSSPKLYTENMLAWSAGVWVPEERHSSAVQGVSFWWSGPATLPCRSLQLQAKQQLRVSTGAIRHPYWWASLCRSLPLWSCAGIGVCSTGTCRAAEKSKRE